MPVGQDEAVPVRPIGDRRVDLEETGPQGHRDIGHAHRHPGMATVGLLHGVHGQRLDRVDRQLLDPVVPIAREATGACRNRTRPAHLAWREAGREQLRSIRSPPPSIGPTPVSVTGRMAVHPGRRIGLDPDMVLGELDETARFEPLVGQQLPFVMWAAQRVLADEPVGSDHPMAGDDQGTGLRAMVDPTARASGLPASLASQP